MTTLQDIRLEIKDLTSILNNIVNLSEELGDTQEDIKFLFETLKSLVIIRETTKTNIELKRYYANELLGNEELLITHLSREFQQLLIKNCQVHPQYWNIDAPSLESTEDSGARMPTLPKKPNNATRKLFRNAPKKYHGFFYFKIKSAIIRRDYLKSELERLTPQSQKMMGEIESAKTIVGDLKSEVERVWNDIETIKRLEYPEITSYLKYAQGFFITEYEKVQRLEKADLDLIIKSRRMHGFRAIESQANSPVIAYNDGSYESIISPVPSEFTESSCRDESSRNTETPLTLDKIPPKLSSSPTAQFASTEELHTCSSFPEPEQSCVFTPAHY